MSRNMRSNKVTIDHELMDELLKLLLAVSLTKLLAPEEVKQKHISERFNLDQSDVSRALKGKKRLYPGQLVSILMASGVLEALEINLAVCPQRLTSLSESEIDRYYDLVGRIRKVKDCLPAECLASFKMGGDSNLPS